VLPFGDCRAMVCVCLSFGFVRSKSRTLAGADGSMYLFPGNDLWTNEN
jgi:hypothetical protein